MGDLPQIPVEDLFTEMEYPDVNKPPLRYWSIKTTMEYLGVSMRQVRRYLRDGKLQYQYKTVKGRKRVFISNQSAIDLRPTLNKYKEKCVEDDEDMDEQEDTQETGDPDDVLGAFLELAESLVGK